MINTGLIYMESDFITINYIMRFWRNSDTAHAAPPEIRKDRRLLKTMNKAQNTYIMSLNQR